MGWECDGKGGRDTECTGRLAGQNAAAGSTAAQLGKQGNALYIIWYVPSSVLEGWSPPQQFSTKLCSVLLFLA